MSRYTYKPVDELINDIRFGKCNARKMKSWEKTMIRYNINFHAYDESAFKLSCMTGHLKVANWLWKLCIDHNLGAINVHAGKEDAFIYSCENGYLEVAIWLWQLCIDNNLGLINIHADDDYAFMRSCKKGHLEVAKWLWQLCIDHNLGLINIHANNTYAFRKACQNGHLEIAKWLWQLCIDNNLGLINVRACNDDAFKWSYNSSHFGVTKWLATLEPAYKLIIENNLIISFSIMDPIDELLEKQSDINYDKALQCLGITKTVILKEWPTCLICHEVHDKIIKLNCEHCICLENGYKWFKNRKQKCMYCNISFNWSDCSDNRINNNQEELGLIDI